MTSHSLSLQRFLYFVIAAVMALFWVRPATASVLINNDDTYTTRTKVTLTITSPDPSYTQMSISTNNLKWGKWLSITSPATTNLSSGDGEKTIYVKYRTAAGAESSPESDTIILETKPPKGTVTVNGVTNGVTSERNVTLTFTFTVKTSPITEMQYAVGKEPWSTWEPYASPKSIELPAGDGPKTIQVKFKDEAGKISAPAKGKITLDTTPPTGTLLINKGANHSHYREITVAVNAKGNPIEMQTVVDGSPVGEWQTFAKSFPLTLSGDDGERTVGVKLKDAAGNESEPFTDTIILATSPAAYAATYVGLTSSNDAYVTAVVNSSGTLSGMATTVEGELIEITGTVDGAGKVNGTGTTQGTGDTSSFSGAIDEKMEKMVIKVSDGPTVTLLILPTGNYAGSYAGDFSFMKGNLSGSIKIAQSGALSGTVTESGIGTYPVTGVVTGTGEVYGLASLVEGGYAVVKGKFKGTDTIPWTYRSMDGSGTGSPFVRKVKSGSFDPQWAKSSSTDKNVPLYWVYEVNGGNTIHASLYGNAVGITPSSFMITQSPTDMKRTIIFSGSLSGTVYGEAIGGNVNAKDVQSMVTTEGVTSIAEELLSISLKVTAQGRSESAWLSIKMSDFTPPYEWFLDRSDLDLLAEGYSKTVTSSAKVTASFSSNLGIPNFTEFETASETWTIAEKIPSLTVKGKAYSNVVKVTRSTVVPDLDGNLTPVTITYWVAKGIGIIKARDLLRIMDVDDISYELVDTNLVQ